MIKALLARRAPLQKTAGYAIYSTACTVSVLAVAPLEHRYDLGISRYIADLGLPLDTLQEAARCLLANPGMMQSCTGFLATALFLTLTFRLNRSASRFWEGRTEFGGITSSCRAMTQTAQLSISNKPMAVEMGLLAFAFGRSAELHLRQAQDEDYKRAFVSLLPPAEFGALLAHPHRPYFFAERMSNRLSDAYDAGHVKNVRLAVSMQALVNTLCNHMEAVERIETTPEPWSYQKHMRFIIELWLGILPIAFLPSLGIATPVLSIAVGYVVYKLDDVAIEMTNPFGYDKSDVGLCLIVDKLQREMLASTHEYLQRDSDNTALVCPPPSVTSA